MQLQTFTLGEAQVLESAVGAIIIDRFLFIRLSITWFSYLWD